MIGRNDQNILIVESPIEFVLIGTFHNRRVVLAKSSSAQIDLLSARIKERSKQSFYNQFFKFKIEKKPLIVESVYVRKSGMDRYDNIEFVWRGLATKNNIDFLNEILNNNVSYIYTGINNYQKVELDWIIAELVFFANEFNNKRYQVLSNINIFMYFFAFLYFCIFIYIWVFKFRIG
ncbi:TPA: hypothetical protein ACGDKW_003941, partial [Acinetobacter baumannii]